MVKKIKISGKRDVPVTPKEIEQQQEMSVELQTKDMDIPRSTEIPIPHADTPKTMEMETETIERKQTDKKLISDKQKAHLQKAREARNEKKRLRKEGTDLGSNPDKKPEYLENFAKLLEDRFKSLETKLSDLRVPLAAEMSTTAITSSEDEKLPSETLRLERQNASVNVYSSSSAKSRDLVLDMNNHRQPQDLQSPMMTPKYVQNPNQLNQLEKQEESLKRKYPSSTPVIMERNNAVNKRQMQGNFILF